MAIPLDRPFHEVQLPGYVVKVLSPYVAKGDKPMLAVLIRQTRAPTILRYRLVATGEAVGVADHTYAGTFTVVGRGDSFTSHVFVSWTHQSKAALSREAQTPPT